MGVSVPSPPPIGEYEAIAYNGVVQWVPTAGPTPSLPTITTKTLPSGMVGKAYSQSIGVSGGTAPYTFAQVGAGIPGLSLIASGALKGTPTTAGADTITVQVSDTYGNKASVAIPITIAAAAPILPVIKGLSPTTALPGATLTIAGSGFTGATAVGFGVVPGPSFKVVSDTTITVVVPTGTGEVDVRVDVPGGVSAITASDQFTFQAVVVLPPITIAGTPTLPSTGQVGVAYNGGLSVSGGTGGPYIWQAQGLPPGLTCAAAGGAISGTPTTAGTYQVTVIVADAKSDNTSETVTVTITPAVVVTPPPPPVIPPVTANTPTASTGTYDNIIEAGQSELVIQSIKGLPTEYQVFDLHGNVVVSGPMPAVVEPQVLSDVSELVSFAPAPPNSTVELVLKPKTTPVIGDTLVVALGTGGRVETVPRVSGGGVSAWTEVLMNPNSGNAELFIGPVTSIPANGDFTVTVTVTSTAGSGDACGVLAHIRGITTAGMLDGRAGQGGNAFPTVPVNGAGDLVIVIGQGNGNVNEPTTFTGFPSVTAAMKANPACFNAAYYNMPAGATTTPEDLFNTEQCNFALVALTPVQGGSTLAIPPPSGQTVWQPGYYYVVFSNAEGFTDSIRVNLANEGPGLMPVSALPGFTAATRAYPGAGDTYMHGFAGGMGALRIGDGNPTNPTAGLGLSNGDTIAGLEAGMAQEQGTGGYFNPKYQDPMNPRAAIITFPITIRTASNAAAYDAGVGQVAAAVGPGTPTNAEWFEGLNEPITQGVSDTVSGQIFAAFSKAVKAGNPNAKAIGPCDVGASYDTWLAATIAAGVKPDGASFHFYNFWNGDFLVTDGVLRNTVATMKAQGLSLPIFCTEAGTIAHNFAGLVQVTDPMRTAMWWMQFVLTGERYGMPPENILYFYDDQHGYAQASWQKGSDKGLDCVPILSRVYQAERYNKKYSHALTFGAIGDNFYRGNVYIGPNNAMVSVYAQGMNADTVTLSGVGTGTITYSDAQGRAHTVTPDANGNITIPISSLPTYVRLSVAAGSTVAVASVGGGVGSGTDLALTAKASCETGAANIALVNDGKYEMGYFYFNNPVYQATTIPEAITLTWASETTFDDVLIRQMAPWANIGGEPGAGSDVMLAGKLEYWNGTEWVACPTIANSHWDINGNYSNPTAHTYASNLGHDNDTTGATATQHNPSYYSTFDQEWCHNVRFSQKITTTQLRWTVTAGSRGNMPDTIGGIWNDSIRAVGLSVSEILVFDL